MIVFSQEPITIIGGAQFGQNDLNTSLKFAPQVVCADRGADAALSRGLSPSAVIGDMDSLSQAAAAAFADLLHQVEEQDTTDFEKVLERVSAPVCLAVGFSGGRLDHILSVLNVMARYRDRRVVLIGASDVAFVLPGTTLTLPTAIGQRVGLMPLASLTASTTGLRWDLETADMAPDGMVSSSNQAADYEVSIECDGPLLVTLPVAALGSVINAVRAG